MGCNSKFRAKEMQHQEMVFQDLLVAISEEAHPKLQREGDNLHYDLYVSLPDAVLGSSLEIESGLR